MISHINDFPKDLEGKKVVVVGGGAVGLDVVEFFADRNADISIVEMMDQIGRNLDPVSKNDTKTMMKNTMYISLQKLLSLRLRILPSLSGAKVSLMSFHLSTASYVWE